MITSVTNTGCPRRLGAGFSCVLVLFLASPAAAQEPPSSRSGVPSIPQGSSSGQGRDNAVTWKTLAPKILQDQRRIYTFPLQLARGRDWIPTLGVLGVTAGLVALDPHDTPYFWRTGSFQNFNTAFSGRNMSLGTMVPPLALYVFGLARHDSYAQSTALLAGESVVDCEILTAVMKGASRRLRPSDFAPNGDYSESWFRGGTWNSLRGAGSFPSGHTIAAFSVATIITRRYPNRPWLPFVAYGLAGLVGFSRVTNQAHFPSDVFMGAALGYTVSRFVVLHREGVLIDSARKHLGR